MLPMRACGRACGTSSARLHGGVFRSYADHRMAHAAAVIGAVVPGVEVDDVAATGKTFPDFPGTWARLLSGR